MFSSVKLISTQRTLILSEAEDLNSLSTLGCSQSNDWKRVTVQKVTHQHADAIVHYILVTLKNNYALVFLCLFIIYEQHSEFHFVSNCLELDWLSGWQLWPISRFFPLTEIHIRWKNLLLETEEQLRKILRFTIAFLALLESHIFWGEGANWLTHNSSYQAVLLCLFFWNYTRVILDGCVQNHAV